MFLGEAENLFGPVVSNSYPTVTFQVLQSYFLFIYYCRTLRLFEYPPPLFLLSSEAIGALIDQLSAEKAEQKIV